MSHITSKGGFTYLISRKKRNKAESGRAMCVLFMRKNMTVIWLDNITEKKLYKSSFARKLNVK